MLLGDLCWGRVAPSIVEAIARRGYALAEFCRTALARDEDPDPTAPDQNWGALAAWAWGYRRVINYPDPPRG